MPEVSISIVSHLQIQLVRVLLDDLEQSCGGDSIEVVLTINVPEPHELELEDYGFPIKLVHNITPKGFGENHNAAFQVATGDYFCVLNPDIRLVKTPFPELIKRAVVPGVGLVAPRIVNPDGGGEDSARDIPTPLEIFRKALGGRSKAHDGLEESISSPDWVAGMFMLFPRNIYQKIGGFDERYFLYYEDVDLCARIVLRGFEIVLCNSIFAIHDARRSSHKSWRYMRSHMASIIRFFLSSVYWRWLLSGRA